MTQITLAIILAMTVEAMVEYSKSLQASVTAGGWKTIIIQLLAVVIAVCLCLLANVDVFAVFGVPLGDVGGCVLTGVLVARGSNYLADFLQRVTNVNKL